MLSFMKEKVLLFVHGMVEAFVVATSFVVDKTKELLLLTPQAKQLAVADDADYVAQLEQEMELNRKHQGVK